EGWGYALREWGEDKTGKQWLFLPLFQKAYDFSEGHGVIKLNHLMGLVDSDKNTLIKPSFANMKKYSEGMLPVSKKLGEWFFVDNKGNTVIKDTFQNVSSFSEGLVSVKKKGKWGYINKKNEVVIPLKYDRAYDFHDGVAVVVSDKNRFFIDTQGRPLSEHYDDVFRVSEGYAAVKVGGLWGYVFIPRPSLDKDSKKSEKQTTEQVKGVIEN
ncbi:MAG: WG repeat-containing protein, partial [Thiotrichaceae bacterium]